MAEQPVIGQVITQDFLGILLDKLSEGTRSFPVQGDALKEKEPDQGGTQEDRQAADTEGNRELISFMHILAHWHNNTLHQVDSEVSESGHKEEEARIHMVALPASLQESVENKQETSTLKRPDKETEQPAAQEEVQVAFPDTMTGFLQAVQTVNAGQDLPVSHQGKETVEDTPVPVVLNRETAVRPVAHRKAAEPAPDFPVQVEAEDSSDTGFELPDDSRVIFRRTYTAMSGQIAVSKDAVTPGAQSAEQPDDTPVIEKIPFLAAEKEAEPVLHTDRPDRTRAAVQPEEESATTRSEVNLSQRNDHFRTEATHGRDGLKVSHNMVTGSVIAERVEQVVEQYAARNSSADMVVRLKIDEKETILVGLKDEGQKVSVQIKTGSEGTMYMIQSQKDAITRHLEGKNIYTTIMVDINDQRGFEKRDRHNKQEERGQEKGEEDFSAFLDALA